MGEEWNWKRVKWVYERKSTSEGTRSSSWISLLSSLLASDWGIFLMDFSSGRGHLFSKIGV